MNLLRLAWDWLFSEVNGIKEIAKKESQKEQYSVSFRGITIYAVRTKYYIYLHSIRDSYKIHPVSFPCIQQKGVGNKIHSVLHATSDDIATGL